jgi:hypothetical protein
VAEQLFLFIQMEFPWALGPPDGRYLLRALLDAEPEHVVVLNTLGAQRSSSARRPSSGRRGPRLLNRPAARTPATPEPATVATARATIVDPVSVSAERQARAWLSDLDPARDVGAAAAVLNRLLHSHRIASADPYIHEVSPAQALVVRAGWGEGEQVAYGRWLHARELPGAMAAARAAAGTGGRRRLPGGRRTAALRPEERLAEMLAARAAPLLCEELALRARLDLDHGRTAHAAIELDRALAMALPELRGEGRQDLALRIDELEQLRSGVARQAKAAMPDSEGSPEEEIVRHTLERLEAALRARTAPGLG